MKIMKDAITHLTRFGYHTLQVPAAAISFDSIEPEYDDYPDEYFHILKHDGSIQRLAFGREGGFIFLSEKGWKHFKKDIQKTFDPCRGSWDEFLKHVENHFKSVKYGTKKYKDNLTRKYNTRIKEVDERLKQLNW